MQTDARMHRKKKKKEHHGAKYQLYCIIEKLFFDIFFDKLDKVSKFLRIKLK